MPCSEDWLTQCLSRIESNEMHISPYLQEEFLCHSLLCKIPILGGVLSKSCHHSVSLPATTFLAFHPSELSSSPQIVPMPHADIIAPANFHNPKYFNPLCTNSKAVEAEEPEAEEQETELVSPLTPRRSYPTQSGEGFDAPPTL